MTRIIVSISVSLISIFLPLVVFAQAALDKRIVPCDGVDCTLCHLATLAQNIINTGIFVAVFMSAMIFAFAGWKYLASGANVTEMGDAKSIILNTVIGLIIILGAWLFVDTIMRTLIGNPGGQYLPWNSICRV
jgi:hypothetical protein